MAPSTRSSVVVYSGPDTLTQVDRRARRAGIRWIRIDSWKCSPLDPATWLRRLARMTGVDTVVVTSRAAVSAGVRPWRRALGALPGNLDFWAAGPGTARALRAAGARRVHRPSTIGANGILEALREGPRRNVVHFRSDLAGGRLARALRRKGHTVADLVVYRTGLPPPLTAAQRRELLRARLLVVTSPSGLSHLRTALGPRDFPRVARTVHLIVLGGRSRSAAQRQRFRRVSVAPATTPQRFTHYLLRELKDAST